MVPQVYYDVGFGENVNYYYTYHKTLCFTNLVQLEVLFWKQSEHSYAFVCSDLLTVVANQMILTT